jgi:PKD repeat protein
MNRFKVIVVLVSMLVIAFFAAGPRLGVQAAPPNNDSIAGAVLITSLPYNDYQDTREATRTADEPYVGCLSDWGASVWYTITPDQSQTLRASTQGSSYSNAMVLFINSPEEYNVLNCAYNSDLDYYFEAGQTYYIMVAALPVYPYPGPGGGIEGGDLYFSLSAPPPPSNDNFADATFFSPFFDEYLDLTAATLEANEPLPSCVGPESAGHTVWYALNSAATEFLTTDFYPSGGTFMAVYSGTDLGNLAELACSTYGPLAVNLDPGVTYFFQFGDSDNYPDTSAYVSFNVPPPLTADFYYYPYQPSTFDTIYFYDYSYDPLNIGIETSAWDFGDGATASGCCVAHQYAADGTYPVSLTITTYDGRTASTTQDVIVQTHDVAITKLSVPNNASVGQTKSITISIRNEYNPEYVTVDFYRSDPTGYDGFVWLASQEVYLPVGKHKSTTNVDFNYTFRPQDGVIGKVTFKAMVNIQNYPDALPADNVAISPIVKVK